ncbi:MAG: PEP/pyruvate-binding domain-containing protein [Thermodesulfobacteriota bacterium]|nr:PEP/pyruvate-binding domain-containing protein [Thermodesulfobacteriota bacterium]
MLLKNLFKYWTYQVFSPGTVLREKYEAFKSLLAHDKCAHEVMAELEEIYYDQIRVDFQVIAKKYDRLAESVSGIIEDLSRMCPSRYLNLKDYFKKFDFYIRFMLAPPEYNFSPPFAIQLDEIPSDGRLLVGGKALQLSVIKRDLELPIPSGFVITTNAFFYLIEHNDLRKTIDEKLAGLDINSTPSLDHTSDDLVALIMNSRIPPDIENVVLNAFKACQWTKNRDVRIAMRSSAVCEDEQSSFAGQYLTVLNVKEENILDAYKKVIASKYSPRALYYRINYGLSDIETPMAVLALEMVDATASGVIYTQDIDDPTLNYLNIHSIWGLGDLLVSGEVSPDIITVTKEEKPTIVMEKTGVKHKQMTLAQNRSTEVIPVYDNKKQICSIDRDSVLTLTKWGAELESFYGVPQDIEWCKDIAGRLFILQSRPLKIEEVHTPQKECKFDDIKNAVLVSGGETASSGIGAGRVFKIDRKSDLENLPKGAVLVARNASPYYVTVMGRINAVVTDTGSTAGHFASVAREFGVPTLVNTDIATANLSPGREVTVHANGKIVYDGIVSSLIESLCTQRDLLSNSPFMRKLRYIISFISPLKLVDPASKSFKPEGCRSLHDIIRFSHEKAVQEMFSMGDRKGGRKKGAKKLISKIPMLFYVLDVGGGIEQKRTSEKEVRMEAIISAPMKAVFSGLTHPDIYWSEFTHFDWEEYDKVVMSGGIISADSARFGSYAVLSSDYLNLNLRFGYHFVILDTICGDKADENYILFRFSGGGGDSYGKSLRAGFIGGVLERLGFMVDIKGDLVDGQFKVGNQEAIFEKLDMVGRLLGATRLMDMYLKDSSLVEGFVDDFMNGRYHFSSIED